MTPPSSVFTNGLTRPYSVSYPLLFLCIFLFCNSLQTQVG
ncbi:hypothetical protein CsSME_00029772 [Camellia sinensis var. sinensis]